MNVLTLRSRARSKSTISNTDTLSNADLLTLLNEGYYQLFAELAKINEDFFEEQKSKFNLGLNSSLFSLPTDCLKIKQIRLAYSAPSSEADYKIATPYDPSAVDIDLTFEESYASTSNPIVDITNNYYRIKPAATAAVTNGGEIYYIARPSALTNTGDSPVLPVEIHEGVATFAARQACLDRGLWERWKALDIEWQRIIQDLAHKFAPRDLNKPERFRNVLETGMKSVQELW